MNSVRNHELGHFREFLDLRLALRNWNRDGDIKMRIIRTDQSMLTKSTTTSRFLMGNEKYLQLQ